MLEQEPKMAYIIIDYSALNLKRRVPVKVYINDSVFLLSETDDRKFKVKPGDITLSVDTGEMLQFTLSENETKEFKILMGIKDWKFTLKYGFIAALMLLCIFLLVNRAGDGKSIIFGLAFLLFSIWSFWKDFNKEFLLIEEQ